LSSFFVFGEAAELIRQKQKIASSESRFPAPEKL
jgi:hypothetical protein